MFLSVIAVSCSSDDSSAGFSESELIGKWYLSSGSINGGSLEPYIHKCTTQRDFQEFQSTHELTLNKFNQECNSGNPEVSNWKLQGKYLTVSNTHFDPMLYNYKYEIITLNATDLVLQIAVETPEGTVVERVFLVR